MLTTRYNVLDFVYFCAVLFSRETSSGTSDESGGSSEMYKTVAIKQLFLINYDKNVMLSLFMSNRHGCGN